MCSYLPESLSVPQLQQRFEQQCVIFQSLSDPFVCTCSAFTSTAPQKISRLLLYNANTLLSQLATTLCICDTYRLKYPLFGTIVSYLPSTDQALLIAQNNKFCSTFWTLLKFPPSAIFQVTHTEIMIDPYLRSLQENYNFPLSTEMSSEMQIDSNVVSDITPPPL
jgi:hypothetical protein